MKVMEQYDADHTLHYCDPPYLGETRKDRSQGYRHEMHRLDEHLELLNFLKSLRGKVIISGYRSRHYDEALMGWYSCSLSRGRDQTNKATAEQLWMNFEPKGELL